MCCEAGVECVVRQEWCVWCEAGVVCCEAGVVCVV